MKYAYLSDLNVGATIALEKVGRAGGRMKASDPRVADFKEELVKKGYLKVEGDYLRTTDKANKEMYPNRRSNMDDFMTDDMEGEELVSRFEEGKPADPTKNMSPEDKEKWENMTDKYKDKFTKGGSLRDEVIKLAHNKPELRNYLLPLVVTAAETFKCPTCGTKVLKQTGFCVKCKKKVKES